MPEPKLPLLGTTPYSMIVDGVGGTGVVTVSAVLAQAAHIAGLGFGSIDMTGIAQKGGAVACHMKVARDPDGIHAIRVGVGSADLVIGGDLVVTASNKILDAIQPDVTAVVCSTYEQTTGDFARKPDLTVPGAQLRQSIETRLRRGAFHGIDAHDYATRLFGDSIMSNMLLVGFAYQLGKLPIPAAAIEEAIALNGAAVEMNLRAFRFGRLAAHDRTALNRIAGVGSHATKPTKPTLEELVARRAEHLSAYQDAALAQRYRDRVGAIAKLESERVPGRSALAEAVAQSYHKLLAVKDEYEVARLYSDGTFAREVAGQFEGVRSIEFHMAPPFLARFWRDTVTGHSRKVALPGWLMQPAFRLLVRMKGLRGGPFDLFGKTAERCLERQMIADYEGVLDEIAARLTPSTYATAVALAALPLDIKGFGHVKLASYEKAKAQQEKLLAALRAPAPVKVAAE